MNRAEAKEAIRKIEDLVFEANKLKGLLHREFYFNCNLEEVNINLLDQFDQKYTHHYAKDTLKYFDCKTFEEVSEKYYMPLDNFPEMYPDKVVRLEDVPNEFKSCQTNYGNVQSQVVIDILRDAYLSESLTHEEMMCFLDMIDYKNHDVFPVSILEEKFLEFMTELNQDKESNVADEQEKE